MFWTAAQGMGRLLGHLEDRGPRRGLGTLAREGSAGGAVMGGFARAVSSSRNLANLGSDLRSTSDALQEAAVPPNQRPAEVALRRRWKLNICETQLRGTCNSNGYT